MPSGGKSADVTLAAPESAQPAPNQPQNSSASRSLRRANATAASAKYAAANNGGATTNGFPETCSDRAVPGRATAKDAGMLREVITPMATATIATKTNANAATPTPVRDVCSSQ